MSASIPGISSAKARKTVVLVRARAGASHNTGKEGFEGSHKGLRSAGATVIFDDSILPDTFAVTVARVGTSPYVREGTEEFLAEYGPAQYHSGDEYQRAVGSPLPATIIGGMDETTRKDRPPLIQAVFETDPQAEANEDPRYFRATDQPVKGRIQNILVMTFAARRADGSLAPASAHV